MAKKTGKYSKKASEEVGEALHKQKRGQQRSGTKGKAKSRKQAIAIGLAKARKEGAKVPSKSEAVGSFKKSSAKKKAGGSKKRSSGKQKSATNRSISSGKKTKASKKRSGA